ncbi:hypothetical protein SDC9_204672 [bioreactor metagenome]|uniref:Uncharacterized protein n=1 Tax=bioreactor metagenome TaxID=1076179 RepID=A0A645IZX9_9ZZZZ
MCSYRFFGQIVISGSQATGQQYNIAAQKSIFQALPQAAGIIPHHLMVININPQMCQATRNIGGVGIDHIAEQQLGAHTDNFRVHLSLLLCYRPAAMVIKTIKLCPDIYTNSI